MGAGKPDNKHGVGTLVNKKWRKRIIWTDCINGRATATSIVYFLHSEYADHHVERTYRSIERLTKSNKKNIHIVGGWFGARAWCRTCQCWTAHSQRAKQKRRRDETMADDTELRSTWHDVQKKHLKKQATYGTPQGVEKKLDYMLVDRKHIVLQQRW